MNKAKMRKYANLLIRRGVNLQPGQLLYVEAVTETEPFITLLAEEAFAVGGSDVAVNWICSGLDRVRMENAGCSLSPNPAQQYTNDWLIENRAAYLRLDSPELHVFDGVPAGRIQEKSAGERALRTAFREKGTAQNSIACVPTLTWAKSVYPDLAPEEALERLWDAVFACTFVNEDDPVAAWDETYRKIVERRAYLEGRQYKKLHLKSAKTDLVLGMPEHHIWEGGGVTDPNGVYFMPNLPSFEVFASPHKMQADGYVAATMPLNYQGRLVDEFVLTLKEGKVVDCSAKVGEDILRGIVEFDEGSCRLGEIAIVEQSSPVARQHVIFYNTVYDENASCHIALGRGFFRSSPEDAAARGINVSTLHVDFMFGSDDMHIQGQTADGVWEDILVDGAWAI